MTLPVSVQFGNHSVVATMPSLPRTGDRVCCAFPSSIGDEHLTLIVERVYFHQPPDTKFEGKECPHPFFVVVSADGAPEAKTENDAIMKRAEEGGSK